MILRTLYAYIWASFYLTFKKPSPLKEVLLIAVADLAIIALMIRFPACTPVLTKLLKST